MKILKSIGAVAAGFISVAVLSVVTDIVLEKTGVFPPVTSPELYTAWMLALALAYRTLFTVAGGYITGALAPDKPVKHAVILGAIGMLAATLGSIANWSKSAGAEWYPILLILLSIPATYLGGKLRAKST